MLPGISGERIAFIAVLTVELVLHIVVLITIFRWVRRIASSAPDTHNSFAWPDEQPPSTERPAWRDTVSLTETHL